MANTFRIFVSSTFSDLHAERNALREFVFPRLRELCLQNNCRFQAIDLRWGVSEEAGRDQKTMKICLQEIRRCQQVTPRPNFIVLLGDRYGWSPLPEEIPAAELEQIKSKINDSDRAVLVWEENQPENQKGWYRLDKNAEPNVYCLQPRGEEIEDYGDWEKVERNLRTILESAVENLAFEKHESRAKYVASATEQEIIQGLSEKKAKEHVFCFFRGFADRGKVRSDFNEQTRHFFEFDENKQPNKIADLKLAALKKRLREDLPKRNVRDYSAKWLENSESDTPHTTDHIGNLPEDLEECKKLIGDKNAPKTLCVDVWRQLSRVILAEIAEIESLSEVEKEKENHKKFGEERAKNFVGRAEYLERIKQYIESEIQKPLVLWGESGSGKSALIARAIAECAMRNADRVIVSRFIGATPKSSDIRGLLESLCREISDDKTDIPADYNELVKEFPKRLAQATKEKPLVVLLDALDQLSDSDTAHNLRWLPENLPENVRLIVSTLPNDSLDILKRRLSAQNIIELKPMPKDEGGEVLDLWLADKNRTLQDRQRAEILDKFSANGLPLYLKFAFEEARLWHSYDEPDPLPKDVEGIINKLFARLSEDSNHGAMMVSRSLGYLAASRHGLTEDELLDVLSEDKEVLTDFINRSPTERAKEETERLKRLPVVIWSRLYFDLEPYLTERMANNTSLLAFYHRKFGEKVNEEYLKEDVKRLFHFHLSNYFEGRPLYLKEEPEIVPNVRKAFELPYQLIKANQPKKVEQLLCDLRFLDVKCRAELARDILSDFEACESIISEQQTDLFDWRDFIKKNVQKLSKHPKMIVALANHEGFENARKQAISTKWSFPWLRTAPEKMPAQETSKTEGLHAKLTSELELPRAQAIAVAEKKDLAFWFEQLGKIRVLDIREMLQTENILSIRRERPLNMVSDPEATTLAVFYESGDAELYRFIFGADNLPNSLELVLSFQFHLPECEDPIVKWHDGAFWFQSKENETAFLIPETLQIFKEQLPIDLSGELSALVFVGNQRLLGFRQGTSSLLYIDGKPPLKISETDIYSACYCGNQKAAVAFTNGKIVIYEIAEEIVKRSEIQTETVMGELGWNDQRLLWFQSPRRFVSWDLSELTSKIIEDNEEILPLRLLVIPKFWLKRSDITILLVANNKLATFCLEDGDFLSKRKIETLFGGENWRAVDVKENDQWLIERNQTKEMLLAKSVPRLYCGIDGQDFLYAADGQGRGSVFDLKNLQSIPIRNCPLGANVSSGDAERGCWLTDRLGDIHYVFANGQCKLIEKIGLNGVAGPLIYAFDNHLIWFGHSDKWMPGAGSYSAQTFIFFRREVTPICRVERIGEKFFAIGDGLVREVLFDLFSKRLVIVWKEHKSNAYFLRTAKIQEFVNDVYFDQKLDEVSLLNPVSVALSRNGCWVGLISELGELHIFRVKDGKEVTMLAGYSKFSAIATGKNLSDFWLIETKSQVYCGNLENAL